jgi:hypothetical protein
MGKFNQFSAENVMMSVFGHLLLLALMITSFSLVVNRAKLVAPDRIQIVEIDLDSVVVSGDETKLYNVGVPEQKAEKKPEVTPKKEEVKEEVLVEKKEIETTALVEEETKQIKEEVKEEPVVETKPEKEPVPKKKRVVKVNREVLSLDRTLTISVVDALRVAMTRCWVIDSGRPDIADIRAVAHLKMRKNGTVQDVWFESAARAETDPAFAYVLGTIKEAIDTCQPFRMLPPNEFSKWQNIQLTFYPTQGKVM